MATHHARAGEIVDLDSWADDLPAEKSKVIAKTDGLELARLVIAADTEMHHSRYCQVAAPIVIHCLEGEIELKSSGETVRIKQGQLVYLQGKTEHALRGVTNSIVLLTIVLNTK